MDIAVWVYGYVMLPEDICNCPSNRNLFFFNLYIVTRKEFSTKIRVAVIKRATIDCVVYCERCGLPTKDFQIDHIIPDSQGGTPTLGNAQLLGKCCYSVKNTDDTKKAAKTKRVEAKHLGASQPKQQIKSRAFSNTRKREPKQSLRPRALYQDV